MLCKWLGIGLWQYFRSSWDCFDFFLVVVSTVEAVVGVLPGGELPLPPAIIRVLRLFRVIRVLRIVKTVKQLRTVLLTVYTSLPQLTNIMLLIGLLVLIYDVLLVSLFFAVNYTPGNFDDDKTQHAFAKSLGEKMPLSDAFFWSDDGTNWGDAINRHANFAYFWTGALTLVRSSTGESFNGIMHDLYDWSWGHNRLTCCPQCGPIIDGVERTYTIPMTSLDTAIFGPGENITVKEPLSSCGLSFVAVSVYGTFQMVMAYMCLSIMIGVIIENFSSMGSGKIRVEDIEEFRSVWLKYDPQGSFAVPSENLIAILQQLQQPLGFPPGLTRAELLQHIGTLNLPDHGGYIHFLETLTACANFAAGVPVPVCELTGEVQKTAGTMIKKGERRLDGAVHNVLTINLVDLLQGRFRSYLKRSGGDEQAENQPLLLREERP